MNEIMLLGMTLFNRFQYVLRSFKGKGDYKFQFVAFKSFRIF